MLQDILLANKQDIAKRWTSLTIDTYPPEAGSFMKKQKNQFANPVGAAIANGAETLLGWVISSDSDYSAQVVRCLDDIVRIRAVQEFSASESLGFIFLLKKIIKESVPNEMARDPGLVDQLVNVYSRIDSLALTAFDIYMKCREKLFEIRAMEIRNRTSRILERACMKYGAPHDW